MSLFLARSAIKQLLSSAKVSPYVLSAASYSPSAPKITFEQYSPPKVVSHDDRNAGLKRPLSPHLTIYSLQLTSTLSITHRITGMMLSGYFMALGMGALALPYDVNQFLTMVEGLHLSPATIFLAKFLIAAPMGYHTVNGIRHLWWDTGKGLSIKEVYASGYAMLGLATLLTVAITML